MEAPAKVGVRSRDRSNIGYATRPSATMNAASAPAPTARQMMTPVSDQPSSPARISP